MLDQKQAEAVADALLREAQSARDSAAERQAALSHRLAVQRRAGAWGLGGLMLGALLGHVVFNSWAPSAIVGFGLFAAIGRWGGGRRA